MNIILENEFGDKLILEEDKSKTRIEYSSGHISKNFRWNNDFKMFFKDEMPGSNTNEEILLLNSGVVWSTGCGYSGTSTLYSIPSESLKLVREYFNKE